MLRVSESHYVWLKKKGEDKYSPMCASKAEVGDYFIISKMSPSIFSNENYEINDDHDIRV